MTPPREASTEPGPDARLDEAQFEQLVGPLLPALRLHCYRLVGSLDDAEDMTQEALIRAWRSLDRLDDPSGLRPWLYRIATNACLDLLDRRRRRPTVADDRHELGGPDPYPDAWLADVGNDGDPADGLVRREGVGLAFLAAVQLLAPRQRAILVLRDVLDWPAAEVAEALETTTAAVNSGLQRARAAIRERLPAGWLESPSSLAQAQAREVARRYLDAWERADGAALAELLTADARMAMPPDPEVFEGPAAIVGYLEAAIFSRPSDQRLRLAPTMASGQPAFIVIEPDPATGRLRRIGLMVLSVRGRYVGEIRGYMRADLAERFSEGHGRSAAIVGRDTGSRVAPLRTRQLTQAHGPVQHPAPGRPTTRSSSPADSSGDPGQGGGVSKANEYLQALTALMEQLTASGYGGVTLECKHFFGGAAVYADGRICMSLTAAGFAIKLPEESRKTLMNERGARDLRYFPDGPIKRDYVVLPSAMLEDMKTLRHWVRVSIDYALSLPAPTGRRE